MGNKRGNVANPSMVALILGLLVLVVVLLFYKFGGSYLSGLVDTIKSWLSGG